jgi:hypothetical protein
LPGDVNASRAKTESNLWARTLSSSFDHFIKRDKLFLLIKFSPRHTGGSAGLHYPDMTVFTPLPGFAKIAPWWLACRDYFLAKAPGRVSAGGATNVYSLNRRAVMFKRCCAFLDKFALISSIY